MFGFHFFIEFFKIILSAFPLQESSGLPFLAKLGNTITALGETDTSTPGAVSETEASTFLRETEASTTGEY